MHKSGIIILLTAISSLAFGQKRKTIPDEKSFAGIEIGKTTLEKADRILRKKSFKDPKLYLTSIKGKTLKRHHYFIEINSAKVEVRLKGYSTVGHIQVVYIGGGTLHYKDIALGETKVKDIKGLAEKDWEVDINILDRDTILATDYNGIRMGVNAKMNDDLLSKKIERFILKEQ